MHVNNQGSDQAVHQGSLIGSFVICLKPPSLIAYDPHCDFSAAKKKTIAERLKSLLWGHVVFELVVCVSVCVRASIHRSEPYWCLEHISYIILGRNPKFDVWIHLGVPECHILFSGHFDLDL